MSARIRPAGPQDAALLADLLRGLSPASAFHRFMAGLGEPKPKLLRGLLRRDGRRGAWLAVQEDGVGEYAVGHACWSLDGRGVVEAGVVVTDRRQRQGLGRRLLEAAVTEAATAGGTRLHLDVHPDNRSVVRLLRARVPAGAVGWADGLVTVDVPAAVLLGRHGPGTSVVDVPGPPVRA